MTYETIEKLLAQKHSRDVFISQCKTGPSWEGLSILDAWAMTKSWANPRMIGYEVKVSRNDFLNDNKWQNYLEYCNEFYFVCPPGMILKEELPNEVGLMYVSTTGTRLFTKKKAVWRKCVFPENLARYLLMNRVVVTRDQNKPGKDFWEHWLENKTIDSEFGYNVGKTLKETINKRILDVERENKTLKSDNEIYAHVKEFLKKLDIDTRWASNTSVEREIQKKIELAEHGISEDLIHYLDMTLEQLTKVRDIFNKKEF